MSQPASPIQEELIYEDRFWEQYVGQKLVSDPVIAIVELVANCWDAGAKRVEISWPENIGDPLVISDDGEGMTRQEFLSRWGRLSYDRTKTQARTVDVTVGTQTRKRKIFGKNGIGRFAAFCFANEYFVSTRKGGQEVSYLVKKGRTQPLEFELQAENPADLSGTVIRVESAINHVIRDLTLRTELGRRFLTDPSFEVRVNGVAIVFEDIENKGLERMKVEVPDLQTHVIVKIIDAQRTDPTGRQHGVAWHVNNRLVGECAWKDPAQQSLIDGRRIEAKRFTFIIEADLLDEKKAVKPDWSGFYEENEAFKSVNAAVQEAITKHLLKITQEKRKELTSTIRRTFSPQVRKMTLLKREKWTAFVDKVAEECPSLSEQELKSISGVLANMEIAGSQYGLLHKLHDLSPDQIDDLHKILEEWTVDMAKIVLDEIQTRIKLIEELRLKTSKGGTLEVQELQPLFRQGLWIFGPEFETIHFTSNEGMTRVIEEVFGPSKGKGSRNRPDFAIVPDGSVGLYDYPEYDEQGGEIGPAQLVIVELKAPDVPITEEEKSQCYKYVRELAEKGLLKERTKVRGFVLGRSIKAVDSKEKTEMDGRVRILPLDFNTVLQRADSRLLKLRDKIKAAPFFEKAQIDSFLNEDEAL